ncbi:MAG: thioredoxin family protein [Verrucomicrobia bacterium]|nr:thioredoxin family protein [Verrucomicrobiota bacterium]
MRLLLQLLLLICLITSTAEAATTKAQFLLSAEAARPGSTILAGVELKMKAGWHTYWRNPGESGGTTEIEWELPSGISAGPIQWPVPEKYFYLDEFNYAYHGNIILLVPITIAPNAKPGEYQIRGNATWIECEEVCLPGSASISATFKVGDEGQFTAAADALEEAKAKLPLSGEDIEASVRWDKNEGENSRSFIIEWNTAQALPNPDFYPYESDGFDVLPQTEVVKNEEGTIQLRKTIKKFKGEWPEKIAGLLVEDSTQGQDARAYEIELSFDGKAGAGGAASGKILPLKESLVKMLFFAFLGGLILNVMPCVLPIIALKVLGFVQQSREEPARVKTLGFVYMAGVLVSFLVLALFVIGLQIAGKAAGWGMQFQNPQFVVIMATVITLVALNLFGVFEVNLGGRTMAVASGASGKEGAGGSFLNGVLATVLATPCMAPFLATAIGFAFTQPPLIIALLLLTVGFGLALPYVVLSWNPRLMKFLPKPGAWMEKFKIALGFPLLATAIWLLSLTSDYFGSDGPLWVGLFLTCVAAAAWIWGSFIQRGTRRKAFAVTVALLFIVGGYIFALEKELQWRGPLSTSTETTAGKTEFVDWEVWSPEAVEQFRAEGRPVLVDFTANWCLTCKYNKRTSIEIESVGKKLKEINAVALTADYTRGSDAITAELKKYDRAGVPLVLVFPADASQPANVLPTILTPGIVLEALDKAAK